MDFENLLIGTLDNSNEVREQAEVAISQYKEANYPDFLFKLLDNISKTDNPISFYISFALILQDVRNGLLFSNNELFKSFMINFLNTLKGIFISNKLNEATCNIISNILISITPKIQLNISQFLIESIYHAPQLQFFFINTLAMILLKKKTRNTISFEVYISILSTPNASVLEYNSKLLLLFSIVHYFPQNSEQLCSIFLNFLSNVSEESTKYVLNLITDHVQSLSSFFSNCINDILIFITKCIGCNKCEISILAEAIDCLTFISIAYNDSYEILYTILSIVLQMVEPENAEESEIGSVLKESLYIMSNNSQSCFLNALNNIKSEKNFNFSYLIALSKLHMSISFRILDFSFYFNQIAELLLNSDSFENPFKIKFAAFQAIENLCNINGFIKSNFEQLFMLLCKELFEESNQYLIILVLKCLSIFFTKVKFDQLDEKITALFSFLIHLLMDSKDESIMSEVIGVIENFTISLSSLFIQFYPSIIESLKQIDLSKQPDLIVPVISLCGVCVSSVTEISQTRPELVQHLNKDEIYPFFQCALEMRNRVENECDFDHISYSIISFINFFGVQISPVFVSQIIPMFIADSSIEIEVTHLPENHGVESIPGFINVSPFDFAKISSIRSIQFALTTIQDFLSIVKTAFQPFSKDLLDLIVRRITYPFYLEEISRLCWMILDQILLYFGDGENIDLNITFSLFLNNPQNEINSRNSCEVLKSALKLGIERHCLNFELVSRLFEAFFESLQSKFQNLPENDDEYSEDDEYESDKIIDNETDFFLFCFELLPEVSIHFYQQAIIPFISQVNHHPKFSSFSIKVTTSYLRHSRDLSFFCDFEKTLFDSLYDLQSDSALSAMESIGEILNPNGEFSLPLDFYVACFQKMAEFLKDKVSFEENAVFLKNEIIISFTKLLWHHPDVFNAESGIDLKIGLRLWFDSISDLLNTSKNFVVFDFFSFLVREKAAEVIGFFGPAFVMKKMLKCIGRSDLSAENTMVLVSFIRKFIAEKGNPFVLQRDEEESDQSLNENDFVKLQKILK